MFGPMSAPRCRWCAWTACCCRRAGRRHWPQPPKGAPRRSDRRRRGGLPRRADGDRRGAVPARGPGPRPRQPQHRSSAAAARFPRARTTRPPSRASGSPSPRSSACRACCVVGSNLRQEMPLLAHRIRKAAVQGRREGRLPQSARASSICFRSPPTASPARPRRPSSRRWCGRGRGRGDRRCRPACRGGGERRASRAGRRAQSGHAARRDPRHAGAAPSAPIRELKALAAAARAT